MDEYTVTIEDFEHGYEDMRYADNFDEAYYIGRDECQSNFGLSEGATFTIENLTTGESTTYDKYGNQLF